MTIIYILELEYGKYYVGKTDDVDKRYQQHLNGQGSYFTKKYKPVRILRIVPDANDFDEDRYVKEMMADHGIDNVRGGSYSNNLTYDQIAMLEREIRGARNLCLRCGQSGHFIERCYARRDANGVALDDFNTTNNDDMDLKTAIEALVVKKASECTIC
jgi:hypothetical protein